jgi:hypothetical protein
MAVNVSQKKVHQKQLFCYFAKMIFFNDKKLLNQYTLTNPKVLQYFFCTMNKSIKNYLFQNCSKDILKEEIKKFENIQDFTVYRNISWQMLDHGR